MSELRSNPFSDNGLSLLQIVKNYKISLLSCNMAVVLDTTHRYREHFGQYSDVIVTVQGRMNFIGEP